MTIGAHFRTSGAEIILPTLLPSPNPPPGAAVWPAVWTQLIAATATDYVLCGADVDYRYTGGGLGAPGADAQIQVGIGAAGFETIVAQAAWASAPLVLVMGTADILFLQASVTHPFKPVLIPAGTRIAVRSCNLANVSAVGMYVTGYDSTAWDVPYPYYEGLPDLYTKGVIGTRSRVYPDAAFNWVFSPAAGWVFGAPVAFIAATVVPTFIRGMALTMEAMAAVGSDVQAEVCMGVANVVVARVSFPIPGTGPTGGFSYIPRPFLVPPGTSVSIRVTDSVGAVVGYRTQLMVEEML